MEIFHTIEYLKAGTKLQREAYKILTKYTIFERLECFLPVLVGTIPLDISIENSDLDIICQYKEKQIFTERIYDLFSQEKDFTLKENGNIVLVNFWLDSFELEVYSDTISPFQQNGYKHMIIEHQILQEKGKHFKQQVIELKEKGYKTEPAFAKLLNIEGDPYKELLNYKAEFS